MKSTESGTSFEETPDRLKITIPVKPSRLMRIVFSASLIVWLAMLVLVVSYVLRGLSSSFVLTTLLVLWTIVWFWFGRFLWNRWQYYAANREILFIDEEQVVIRRPLSILGQTTAYDLAHVSPFYYSEQHSCPAFDYAFLHVYFGNSLSDVEARELITLLNARYFPEDEESTAQ
jgi:hypothetical protein